ncbi:hypothetical protein [Marinactinospora rubrisoli]|uniref:Uncharacterized protein n=1 Tax=Marinactinospora rubrisoli TaxID=2715399 RepID=A0ABW2KM17_9ACTN
MATEQSEQSLAERAAEERFQEALRPTTGRSRAPIFPVYLEVVAAVGSDADPAIENVVGQLGKRGAVVVADERDLMRQDPAWLDAVRSDSGEGWDAARERAARAAADLATRAREEGLHFVRVTDGASEAAYRIGAEQRAEFANATGWSLQQLTVVPSSHVGYATAAAQRVNDAVSVAGDDGAQRIRIPDLPAYEEDLRRAADRAVTPGKDTDFERSGIVANGRVRPFVTATRERTPESSLAASAQEATERNPQRLLGQHRRDGRYVQGVMEELRTHEQVDNASSVRKLAQEYSGANQAADAWGPQQSGVLGRMAGAAVKVTDAVSGAKRSSHKPSTVRVERATDSSKQQHGHGI